MTKIIKQERPPWCPHPKDCIFLRTTQDVMCVGRLPEPQPHGRVKCENTHRWCIKADAPDEKSAPVIDYQVNAGDVWWMTDFLNTIRKDHEEESKPSTGHGRGE